MNLKAQNRIFGSMRFSKLLALILTICVMSCVTAHADTRETTYIDENGNSKTVDATVLTGHETYLYEGWYVAYGEISFDQTIRLDTNVDVRIILHDGCKMTINNSGSGIATNDSELGALYIYGQSGGTGTLSIDVSHGIGIDVLNFTQNGGIININAKTYGIAAAYKVNINGGTLNITSGYEGSIFTGFDANTMLYTGYITIKSGTVSVNNELYAGPYRTSGLGGTITLGLTSGDNGYIKAGGYSAGTVKIADEQILSDGTNTYSGTLTSEQINAIAGQTLVHDSNYYSYVDENGDVKYVHATPLKSSNQTQSLKDGWYIVNDNVSITDVPEYAYSGTSGFFLSGNSIHIILADGKTMTIGSNDNQFSFGFNNYGISNLYIYGQKEQTGTLKIYARFPINADNAFIQNGGNIILSADNGTQYSCGIFASRTININNGTLSIDINGSASSHAISTGRGDYTDIEGSLTISGGKVRAKGANLYAGYTPTIGGAQGTITLGYRNETDYISADAYTAKTVKVASGQILMVSGDTSKLYSGDITASKDEIAGKILVPYEIYTISYDYALNDGESLLNEGYIMVVSLDESADVLSLQLGSNEAENMISVDKRKHFTLLRSSDVFASSMTLKATADGETSFIFEPNYPEEALEVGTHEIAVNSSTTKGTYKISALSAGILNLKAYAKSALPMIVLDPARKGYTFSGWTVSPSATTLTQKDGYYELSDATENLTLTANWTLNNYTIKYVDADMSDTTYTVLDDTFTLNNPKRDGYTFVGWKGTELNGAVQSVTIPTGSTGNRTYTAVWQKSFEPDDKDKPEIHQHAMILGSQIVVIFYAYLPDSYTSADCTMSFDVSGDITANPKRIKAVEAVSDGDYTLYGYPCYINSIQMADTIHAAIYDKDGNAVLTEDYTAKTYLDRVIASDDVFSSQTVNLCKAIKDYGHYVQIPLAKENSWDIGKDHKEMDYADTYGDDDVLLAKQGAEDYVLSKDANAPSFNYALYLDSKITLQLIFDDSVKDLACTYSDDSAIDDSLTIDNKNVVTIADISAHELGNVYKITGKNGDDTFIVEISPLSYVESVLNDKKEFVTGITNGVTSLYHYYDKTMKYRMKHYVKE